MPAGRSGKLPPPSLEPAGNGKSSDGSSNTSAQSCRNSDGRYTRHTLTSARRFIDSRSEAVVPSVRSTRAAEQVRPESRRGNEGPLRDTLHRAIWQSGDRRVNRD